MPERMCNLRKHIDRAIQEYNKYRGFEANAKIVRYHTNTLIVDFKGTYCGTCGLHDYFEDLIYELKDLINVDIRIEDSEQKDEDTFRVKYIIVDYP
ncbi:MAG: hypothetical protein ACFFBS_04980 [Promethearchaeota archaeon]